MNSAILLFILMVFAGLTSAATACATQSLTYDLDGNRTSDGIWTYQWDPENRLAAMS